MYLVPILLIGFKTGVLVKARATCVGKLSNQTGMEDLGLLF